MVDSMRHWFPKNTDAVVVDYHQLEYLVKRLEPEAMSDYYQLHSEETRVDLKNLLNFLDSSYPYLFHVLSQILQVFQNAREQATVVMEEYVRFYIADRTLVKEYAFNDYKIKKSGKDETEKEKQTPPKKAVKKKAQKRKIVETVKEVEEIPEEVKEDALKRLRPQANLTDLVSTTSVIDAEVLADLVEDPKKGQIRRDLTKTSWDVYYICISKWHAEKCMELLQHTSVDLCLVKRKRGGGDRELLRYGVLLKNK